jgi:hypothetical protein
MAEYTQNIPYWIDEKDSNKVWFNTTLQGNETKQYLVKKQQGFAPNAQNVFIFCDDFETGGINQITKWDMAGVAGIRTDYKIGAYSVGSDHPRYNGGEARYLAKIPMTYFPVGTSLKWTSWNGSWKNTYFWAEAAFGTGSSNKFFGLADTGAGGFNKYEFILTRTGTNSWKAEEYINGTYYAEKTWTQSFTSYFLWGVNIYSRGVEDNSVFTRMDNVFVRKYVSVEPTVTVKNIGNYYLVSVTNNIATPLQDYSISVPGNQLGINSSTD